MKLPRGAARRVALILTTLLPALTDRGLAQPLSSPLTPAQVTCEEQQMGRLLHRLSVAYNGSSLFVWRTAAEGGAYAGHAHSH